jgi:hypothetical protein
LEVLDAAGVADRLGFTAAWVYAETGAGRVPHICVGPLLPLPAVEHERRLREQEHR